MKNNKYILVVLALILWTCERDDICAEGTPTTPRILVEFFDVTDTDELKNVPRLSVYAAELITDETTGEIIFPETVTEATLRFNENSNSVELPLKVTEELQETTIRYYFETNTNLRLDENAATNSNIDIIDVTYTPEFVYVSRACGFKSIFNSVSVIGNAGDDSIDWIQNITFTTSIENEDTTHVQIFH
ncbi:DUF6452 family protein [Winogradskyella litorisediminis]|uniref:DUF6452 family protein n=1 Tax=Winogradskyella litorisediminis TaxID=1156618 RepID=A0ABW3N7Y0_9FLAO